MRKTIEDAIKLDILARSMRWFAHFRHHMTYAERLRFGELMRDCADELDHGERLQNCYVREPLNGYRE